jgi:hypothetical protein
MYDVMSCYLVGKAGLMCKFISCELVKEKVTLLAVSWWRKECEEVDQGKR